MLTLRFDSRAMDVRVMCVRQWHEVYDPFPLVFGDVGTYTGDNRLVVTLRLPITLTVISHREDPIIAK